MSVAFTPVADWMHKLQDRAGANEIVLAYSERRQAIGQSGVSALAAKSGGQHKALWLEMQNWLEASCPAFIDHVNGPLNPAGDDFLYFTVATWRAAAGLNASGFRRKVNRGDAFSYGKIQFRDMRGPWYFEDLQKGFGALGPTLQNSTSNVQQSRSKTGIDQGCEAAQLIQVTDWPSSTWFSTGGSEVYQVAANFDFEFSHWYIQGLRRSGKCTGANIPVINAHSADLYFKPSPNGTWEDIDGLWDGEGLYQLWESFGEATVNTRTVTNFVGFLDTNPVGGTAILSCPMEGAAGSAVQLANAKWLLKWNFTNA